MKIDWKDFNIGLIVDTIEGEGFILSVDKPNDSIGIKLSKGVYKTFAISEISLKFGQLRIGLTQQIGQYVLLFQRIENRLRDFTNYFLRLNNIQKSGSTTYFTAGKLMEKVGILIKNHSDSDSVEIWEKINVQLNELMKIRNTIVHGYMYHYDENFNLDFDSIYFENANGNREILDIDRLIELNTRVINVYYEIHPLLKRISDNMNNNREEG